MKQKAKNEKGSDTMREGTKRNLIKKHEIENILANYDEKNISIATICSHSALQIFHGARAEHIPTIGITTPERAKIYQSFPNARPHELLIVDSLRDIPRITHELRKRNAILIPHGSLIEYVGDEIASLEVPLFGNRQALLWEMDKEKMRMWLKEAKIPMPKRWGEGTLKPPVILKFHGAKGGAGYKILKRVPSSVKRDTIVEEFMIGVRFYPHYFYSRLLRDGYPAGEGRIELLGIDRRIETNADEIYRPMSVGFSPEISFTVVGNHSVVLRESLLMKYFEMGKNVVHAAERLFGGIPGPFCLETIIGPDQSVSVFEISARIVAGTNVSIPTSPYAPLLFSEEMTMGKRIAREIKIALECGRLSDIVY